MITRIQTNSKQMNIKRTNSEISLAIYEIPKLKKYGTMRNMTHAMNGSGNDFQGDRGFSGSTNSSNQRKADFSQSKSDTGNEDTTTD